MECIVIMLMLTTLVTRYVSIGNSKFINAHILLAKIKIIEYYL